MNRMDGQAIATSLEPRGNISHFPGYQSTIKDEPEDKLSYWAERALDLRIMTMAPPTKPYWNTTMVTAWVAVIVGIITVLSAVVGLWYFTWQAAELRGIEKGRQQAEQERMQNEMDTLKKQIFVLEEKKKLEQQK